MPTVPRPPQQTQPSISPTDRSQMQTLIPQQSVVPQPPQVPMPRPSAPNPVTQTVQMARPNTGNFQVQPSLSPQPGTVQPVGNANQTGPHSAQPAPSSAPRLTVQYPQVGATLTSKRGDYTVLATLGAGEFGAVYDCVGPFDQTYAIKMIRPANRPYADVYAEWAREAQRLMSLRHPNVVYIHDAFEQTNLFYLALERCDHPLTPMLGTPMQEGLAIELVRQLLAAVQFLHDNDIVHDDLHPGNVLVTHSSDRPVVKISDFGISHNLAGAPAIRPNVVHHKIMAPEVVSSGYTSKQSDLYQVGLLLYWMVTGAPAIAPGLSYQELVKVVSDGEPRQRAEAIGTPLGKLVAKMLRRRDTYRYTSAKEVWADLRGLPAWQNRQLFPTK
jgi:serine/threonine-protein kinase